jgi:hypothetical protein
MQTAVLWILLEQNTALLAWLCSFGVSFSRLSKYFSENATLTISGS